MEFDSVKKQDLYEDKSLDAEIAVESNHKDLGKNLGKDLRRKFTEKKMASAVLIEDDLAKTKIEEL